MIKSRILRVLLIVVGFISLGLGCVGIALPIIPTTPFLLLTSFCFVKSSVRFNRWFLNSKIYHKYLEGFAKTRSMKLRNELILLLSVSAMLICTMIFVNKLAVTIVMCVLIACKYGYFVWQVKPISGPEFEVMEAKRIEERKILEQEKKEALCEDKKLLRKKGGFKK